MPESRKQATAAVATPTPAAEAADEILDRSPEDVVERATDVGEERLGRSLLDVLITGVIGGLEVSLGGIAAAAVLGSALHAAPGLGLYGGLAIAAAVFPVGFLFVVLGRSELFTENFLIPIAGLLNGDRRLRDLVELWGGSWMGNIAGCAAMAGLLAIPDAIGKPIEEGYSAYADYKLSVPLGGIFVSALLAGFTMTVLTWLVVSVRPLGAKIVAIFAAGYLLFAANLSHAVVGAAMVFVGYRLSHHSLGEVAAWLGVTTAGNLIGGVVLVTAFRGAQTWEKRRHDPG